MAQRLRSAPLHHAHVATTHTRRASASASVLTKASILAGPYASAAARPNHSLKWTRNGRPPWPRLRYAVHFLSPGQGALPPLAP